MRKFLLKIKADLENCSEVQPLDNEEYPHDYEFTVKCTRCSLVQPKRIMVNRFEPETLMLDRIKRTVNVAKKCPDCNKMMYLILVRTPQAFTDKDFDFVPVLEVHTHACAIIEYHLEDQYMCKTLSGEIVTEVDLRRNEWSEFDQTSNKPMTITNFAYEIEELRGNSAISSL